MTMHDMTKRDARCALTRYEVVPVKGEIIREIIPGVSRFRGDELEGKVASLLCSGCVADKRTAYSGSSRRSEQLSCTKYFHPSYGLFYMFFKVYLNF